MKIGFSACCLTKYSINTYLLTCIIVLFMCHVLIFGYFFITQCVLVGGNQVVIRYVFIVTSCDACTNSMEYICIVFINDKQG